MASPLRIAIDARAASHPQPGGFKAYAEGLLEGLAGLATGCRFVVCVDRPYRPLAGLSADFEIKIVPSGPKLVGAGFREQVALPLALARAGLDVIHYPYNTSSLFSPGRRVVSIHDLILLQPAANSGSLHRRLMNAYSRLFLLWSLRSAHAILTISHFSAREIAARFPQTASRIRVVYPAATSLFRPAEPAEAAREVAREFGLKAGYVLALGSADPRKNVGASLRAYAGLPSALREAHGLAVVLAHPSLQSAFERECADLGLGKHVTFLLRPSLQSLRLLYAAAGVFVFPSLYEGFGLPPLEAMACGAPVVASNATSIPEVVGEAGLLVDPHDSRALTEALQAVLADPALAGDLRERGRRRAAGFSWAETARQTLAVYREAAGT